MRIFGGKDVPQEPLQVTNPTKTPYILGHSLNGLSLRRLGHLQGVASRSPVRLDIYRGTASNLYLILPEEELSED